MVRPDRRSALFPFGLPAPLLNSCGRKGVALRDATRPSAPRTSAQEALVGGILQEPANEIGHAGNYGSTGTDKGAPGLSYSREPSAWAPPCRKVPEIRIVPGACALHGQLQNGRDGADIMGAAREIGRIMVLEDEAGVALEGRVRFSLVRVDGYGPSILPGPQHFIVPVRALDKPDGDREPIGFGPGEKPGRDRCPSPAGKPAWPPRAGRTPDTPCAGPCRPPERYPWRRRDSMSMHMAPPASDQLLAERAETPQYRVNGTLEVLGPHLGIERAGLEGDAHQRRIPPIEGGARCPPVRAAAPTSLPPPPVRG